MGVIIISCIIYLRPKWIILDPIISYIFVYISLWFSFEPLKEIFDLLLDTIPKDFDVKKLKRSILKNKHVLKINDFHLREFQ